VILILISIISGCNLRKYIPSNTILVNKVKIVNSPAEYKETLYGLSKQKPNKKILGVFKYNMWLYIRSQNFGYLKKREDKIQVAENKLQAQRNIVNDLEATNSSEKTIRKAKKKEIKLENSLGKQQRKYESFKQGLEPPVILDTGLANLSTKQMSRFLFDKGYLKNKVTYKVDTINKGAHITYNIIINKPYYIRKFSIQNFDKNIDNILLYDTSRTLINSGSIYNVEVINQERSRIENLMQNRGYFAFKQQFIKLLVDTNNIPGDSLDLEIKILNPSQNRKHRLFKIKEVLVEPEYIFGDTTIKKSDTINGIVYISNDFKTKPSVIKDFIFIKPNTIYKKDDKKSTEYRLNQLQHVKYVDVSFSVDSTDRDTGILFAYIKMSNKQDFKFTTDVEFNRTEETDRAITNNFNNYYGVTGSTALLQRNVAKSAIQFDSRLRGTIEIPVQGYNLFNNLSNLEKNPNFQIGLINSLIFPQFLIPWKFVKGILPKRWNVENWRRLQSQTSVNLNILYERNNNFQRLTGNINFTYQWTLRNNRFFITPVEVSLVNANPQPSFVIPNDPLIKNLFDKHIITNSRFTWLINQQPITQVRSKSYFMRNSFEFGGGLPSIYDVLFEGNKDQVGNGEKSILGINYYKYVKLDVDYRYYLPIKSSNIAFRIASGLGFPFGGSHILPYEKRYYVGGANSVRGWRTRDIGPGAFGNSNGTTDKSGDFKLEGSVEWRFPVISFLKMALFTDFGNVWIAKKDTVRQGAQLSNKFLGELAIASGVGFRFDFSLFVFRLDFGVKMRDPSQPIDRRWIVTHRDFILPQNTNLNLGIGYPF